MIPAQRKFEEDADWNRTVPMAGTSYITFESVDYDYALENRFDNKLE